MFLRAEYSYSTTTWRGVREHGRYALSYGRSIENVVCTACGAPITDTEFAREGVIRVLSRTGRMQFHPRCFEWSQERTVTEQ
jgi:hypothetical protein